MDLNQVKQIQGKLKQINSALVSKMFEDEILANEDSIIDFVKERWSRGKRPEGGIIGTYKSAEYALFKHSINPLAGGNVDLTLTRSLRNELRLFPLGNGDIKIFSSDEKALVIAEKYGEDVYGLTNKEERLEVDTAIEGVNDSLFEFIGL